MFATILSFALFLAAADAPSSGTADGIVGVIGGAGGLGGIGLVWYLLKGYLPKRDDTLMAALEKKDAQMVAKDAAHAEALERTNARWQATLDKALQQTHVLAEEQAKLRQVILHLAKQPGMTGIAIPAAKD